MITFTITSTFLALVLWCLYDIRIKLRDIEVRQVFLHAEINPDIIQDPFKERIQEFVKENRFERSETFKKRLVKEFGEFVSLFETDDEGNVHFHIEKGNQYYCVTVGQDIDNHNIEKFGTYPFLDEDDDDDDWVGSL